MSKVNNILKMSVVLGGLLFQNFAIAESQILNCSNKDPNNYYGIMISEKMSSSSSLDAFGQISYGPFKVVNVICNNAAVLIELKKDMICAGVDRSNIPPRIVSEEIKYQSSGYSWNGIPCE
jgi:hypothetical protein